MVTIADYTDYETIEYHIVYSALIGAARMRGVVTYQEVARLVGLPSSGNLMGKRVGQLLGAVSVNEHDQGRPMLSALAVPVSGKPGPGFYELARDLGLLEAGADELRFWETQKRQVYEIWQPKYR